MKLNQPGSVFQVADLLVAFLSKEPAPVNTKGIVFPAPSPHSTPMEGKGLPLSHSESPRCVEEKREKAFKHKAKDGQGLDGD